MPIRVDSTKETHVVYCSDCPEWAALRLSKLDGLMRAAEHERDVHPASRQAFYALWKYARRMIDDGNVHTRLEAFAHGNSGSADSPARDLAAVGIG